MPVTKNLSGLAALDKTVVRDLDLLGTTTRPWIPERHTGTGAPILNVLIVGGGQSGLGVAFGLRQESVDRVLIVDENPPGKAGPWIKFARMETLRTPKELTGLDQGIPSLTFRAWYEAQWGEESWAALYRIPREMWAEYLQWFQEVLSLSVRHSTRVERMEWQATDACFAVTVTSHGKEETLFARKVVLATGIDGAGAWHMPQWIRDALPERCLAHTSDPIDFSELNGKRIAILGAGASAFDNACLALDAGVREVRLFFRRPEIVRVDAFQWADFPGFLRNHVDLDDSLRYRFIRHILRMGQLPTRDSWERATRYKHFFLHPGSPWEKIQMGEDGVHLSTPSASFVTDFVIVATGFVTDLKLRSELAALEPNIARWGDRMTLFGDDPIDSAIARHPYLGKHFEFQEKQPGEAPEVQAVFNYNYGSLISHGFGTSGLTGFRYTLQRLINGITGQLYRDDIEHHLENLRQFDEPDF
uniref:Predicted flavoprotein CzcO associated with the cation diffusion facilitator CzcD n=1 Tax=Candidatus Kentrum sp. LFY TaxID=2126342 RepID=A0A450UMN9_9GAMM|nr:MAG: Predicted flavoprotein CzcO associated with the cation diffusion facilitator CzcD [Candidatus Kentron sp. LFY]